MPPDTRARRWLRRALLLLVVGPALVALGHGVGEHAAWPVLQAIAGAPDEDTTSLDVHQVAYATAGLLLAAVLGGVACARRRGDGSWMFNPVTFVIGSLAYGWLGSLVGVEADIERWNLPLLVQAALVSTVYPWVVERAAARSPYRAIPREGDDEIEPELRVTMRNAGRSALLLPVGAGLLALGLGLGEHVAGPAIRALFGPPLETHCVNTWSQEAHWLAYITTATAAAAAGAGVLLGRRRREGWLYFNLASMILGYWAYSRLIEGREDSPVFLYWGLSNWLAQIVLVFTLYPWLFERAASWRRSRHERLRMTR
jgi:hypothetical protein